MKEGWGNIQLNKETTFQFRLTGTKHGRLQPGALNVAKRSYPTSEIRGSGRECQAAMVQERPRGATPRPRPGAARRSHLTPEAGAWPGGATPSWRPGTAAGGANQGAVAVQAQEGLEELSQVEGQEGDTPHPR